mmetsp:Transcript_27146/g.61599  ORF Transcript_27146/g.61599 Transcript_27146/m.61599 type:complete len:352 (-) Transcript_27146:68-1123(-)|eukprot:CAMPEP_0197894766 /NCGR_PEP_ID=MMETSP1439-20131203/36004_1 /TAXON_ID=66791 /ORGANISM="Gonyaulax spinifera, Strain CCMP409" /LENGTH=351 /DNA_ID=CAMNT_0043515149 /DNA_START=53 /DNA_END=1108 /DNA_ORIENTATION=-
MGAFDVVALRGICANYFESHTAQVLQDVQRAQDKLSSQLLELTEALRQKADTTDVPTRAEFEALTAEVGRKAPLEEPKDSEEPASQPLDELVARLDELQASVEEMQASFPEEAPTLDHFRDLEAIVEAKADRKDSVSQSQLKQLAEKVERKANTHKVPSMVQMQELTAAVERKVDADLVPTLAMVKELSAAIERKADTSEVVNRSQIQRITALLELKADRDQLPRLDQVGDMSRVSELASELDRKANSHEVPTVSQLEEHAAIVEKKLAFLAGKVQKMADAREKEKVCQPVFWYASPLMAAPWDETQQSWGPLPPNEANAPGQTQQSSCGTPDSGEGPCMYTENAPGSWQS